MSSAKPVKLSRQEFLNQLAEFASACRLKIEEECEAFPTDPVAAKARIARVQNDYKYFFYTYLPHYARSPEPSIFHDYAFDELPKKIDQPKGCREAIVAPRGEAKSTIVSTGLQLWCIITGRTQFAGLLMDSGDQAEMLLEAVKVELEDNPRLRMDFPDHCGKGRIWRAGQFVTRSNVIVKAAGMDKKLRGWRWGSRRPDLVFLDDIENDTNVRKKEQRDALYKKVNEAVLPLGPPDGTLNVILVGTVLHYDAVVNRLLKSPFWHGKRFQSIVKWPDRMDLWEKWEATLLNEGEDAADKFYESKRKQMDKGAVVSWPSTRPIELLMKIRALSHASFNKEYQGDPTNDADATFTKILFWVQPQRHWLFFGSCDPSLGKNNKRNDPSAILVGGFDRNSGVLDVVEASIRRRVPDRIISDIITFEKEYRCQKWGIESVQFQEFLRTELVKRSAKERIPVPAIPLYPISDKDLRIESLQPHCFNGLIRLHQNQTILHEQLQHWPEADHDDGPDALEMLWKMALVYSVGLQLPVSRPSKVAKQLRGRG